MLSVIDFDPEEYQREIFLEVSIFRVLLVKWNFKDLDQIQTQGCNFMVVSSFNSILP